MYQVTQLAANFFDELHVIGERFIFKSSKKKKKHFEFLQKDLIGLDFLFTYKPFSDCFPDHNGMLSCNNLVVISDWYYYIRLMYLGMKTFVP